MYTAEEFINLISKSESKFRYFIYINNKNEKKYFDKEENKHYEFKNQIWKTEETFIYYDNKHIVGTDIKQPNKLRGITTINSFNRFTDIAQAIYRMRKLNKGHETEFIIKNGVIKFNGENDKIELLNFY